MAIDVEKFRESLKSMTKEEKEKYFPKDTKPKGWISIEDHLPMMMARDILQGGTKYRVKYINGSEGETMVSDHNVWYYLAKDAGVTHWFNK
jgi:hypothetical protein